MTYMTPAPPPLPILLPALTLPKDPLPPLPFP